MRAWSLHAEPSDHLYSGMECESPKQTCQRLLTKYSKMQNMCDVMTVMWRVLRVYLASFCYVACYVLHLCIAF